MSWQIIIRTRLLYQYGLKTTSGCREGMEIVTRFKCITQRHRKGWVAEQVTLEVSAVYETKGERNCT